MVFKTVCEVTHGFGLGQRVKYFIALNALLAFYSLSGVFSKLAAENPFASIGFLAFYGISLLILFLYAIGWQQILKKLPLTIAFSNKAITVVWGIFWGAALFGDTVTVGKVAGAMIVILGIALLAIADNDAKGHKEISND